MNESSSYGNHELIRYMSRYISLSNEEARQIVESLDVRQYRKGDILLKEGQVPHLCFFVIQGCIRQYYLIDGEERTTEFYMEGQPVNVFYGQNSQKASPYFLSCLEDCTLSVGPVAPERIDVDPELLTVCEQAAGDELWKTKETLSMYRLTNPEERYLKLMATRPDIINRVPQYILASYLGIKPESLSRIRKRLMKKA